MYMKRPPAGCATAIAGLRMQRSSGCWEAARPACSPAFCCALCTHVSALHKPDQASSCPSRPCKASNAALMLRRSCSAHQPGAQSTRVAATAAAEARPYSTQAHLLPQLSVCQLSSLCRYGHINGCTAGRSPAKDLYGLPQRPWVQMQFEQRYKHYAWGPTCIDCPKQTTCEPNPR